MPPVILEQPESTTPNQPASTGDLNPDSRLQNDRSWATSLKEIPIGLQTLLSLDKLRLLASGAVPKDVNVPRELAWAKRRIKTYMEFVKTYNVKYRPCGPDSPFSIPELHPSVAQLNDFQSLVEAVRKQDVEESPKGFLHEPGYLKQPAYIIRPLKESLEPAGHLICKPLPLKDFKKVEISQTPHCEPHCAPQIIRLSQTINRISPRPPVTSYQDARPKQLKRKTSHRRSQINAVVGGHNAPSEEESIFAYKVISVQQKPRKFTLEPWIIGHDSEIRTDQKCFQRWDKITRSIPYHGDIAHPEDLLARLNQPYLDIEKLTQTCFIRSKGKDFPGITTPYLYLAKEFSAFALHIEDMGSFSLNYQISGPPKRWFLNSPSSRSEVEKTVKQLYGHAGETDMTKKNPGKNRRGCSQHVRHVSALIPPETLRAWNIPTFDISQEPGDIILTMPFAYHQGWNTGNSVNVAINYLPPTLAHFAKRHTECRLNCGLDEYGVTPIPITLNSSETSGCNKIETRAPNDRMATSATSAESNRIRSQKRLKMNKDEEA